MPATIKEFGEWKAIYQNVHGWKKDTEKAIMFGSLPDDLQSVVKLIEKKVRKEIVFISTSNDMNQGMIRVRHGSCIFSPLDLN